ncbi:transport protein particle component-domain-containing protein [Dipodascopsis tothii]|uniref:transport protein particle component-domain-containing protein n=1 Tax=Dipodascopsis tothii TaxID=44089 RepID=UPI0034CF9E89
MSSPSATSEPAAPRAEPAAAPAPAPPPAAAPAAPAPRGSVASVSSAGGAQAVLSATSNVDPHALYLNVACLEFLLIELVPLAERVVDEISAKAQHEPSLDEKAADRSIDHSKAVLTDERRRHVMFKHVDSLGYRVGQGLVERFSPDRPRFVDILDVIKFICKDVWNILFKKQIDNLKTNHKGVYVLTDNTFRLLMKMSTEAGGLDTITRAQPFLWFPCGVIRGALANLGIEASVIAETNILPVVTFHIQTVRQE